MGKIFLAMFIVMSCGVFINHLFLVNAKTKKIKYIKQKAEPTQKIDSFGQEDVEVTSQDKIRQENRYHREQEIQVNEVYKDPSVSEKAEPVEVEFSEGYAPANTDDISNAYADDDSRPMGKRSTSFSSFEGESRRPPASTAKSNKVKYPSAKSAPSRAAKRPTQKAKSK